MSAPISDDYAAILGARGGPAYSRDVVTRADILIGDQVQVANLSILDATLKMDARANTRSTIDNISIVDRDGSLTPSDAESLLDPVRGAEIRLYMGMDHHDDRLGQFGLGIELVECVTAVLYDVEVHAGPHGVGITGRANDRSRLVSDRRRTTSFKQAVGGNYTTMIARHLTQQDPFGVQNLADTTVTTPRISTVVGASSDPLKDQIEWAAAIGMELFVDRHGEWLMRPVPDPAQATPDWVFRRGGGGLVELSRRRTREGVYSGVVATGTGTSTVRPPRAEAWDMNLESPTYYLGQFQKVPFFMDSNLFTTDAQCASAARARLRKLLGRGQSVTWSAIPNPAIDVNDVALIVDEDGAKVNGVYVIDTVTLPFAPGATMSMTSRVVTADGA